MAVDLSVYDKIGQNSLATLIQKRQLEEATLNKLNAVASHTGGDTPAAIQITNDLQKSYQDMVSNPDPTAREQAKQRYITLTQVAKTYGIDRGMQPSTPAYQGMTLNTPVPAKQLPPVSPQEQKTLDDATQTLQAWNNENPPAMPPSNASVPPAPTETGIRPVSGFIGAKSQIEGAVAGAKEQAQKNVDLNMNPKITQDTNRAGKVGDELGTADAQLAAQSAQYPQLTKAVNDLSTLGKKATYTMAGRALDSVINETGGLIPPRDSAIARAEYIAKVDNEILPLLRQTFGAQFTQVEGETLRNTLGNPNVDPERKDAVLRAFITQKFQQLHTLSRQTGTPVNAAPPSDGWNTTPSGTKYKVVQ